MQIPKFPIGSMVCPWRQTEVSVFDKNGNESKMTVMPDGLLHIGGWYRKDDGIVYETYVEGIDGCIVIDECDIVIAWAK